MNFTNPNSSDAPACLNPPACGYENFRLDGFDPVAVAEPASTEESVSVVRWCRANALRIVPFGGGTRANEGNRLLAERWAACSTKKLTEAFEFSPDDMVVTAGAGITLAELQVRLAGANQYLPIDAPFPDRATMGGIVATNSTGLWRPAYGTPRDRLLGVKVVLADASVVKGGGKVVKNVAGYDLCKLFAGSWGTLGLITEAAFKTNPLPETQRHLAFSFEGVAEGIEAALSVHRAMLQPVYLSAAIPEKQLFVGLAGNSEAVAWQEESISHVLHKAGLKHEQPTLTDGQLRHHIAGTGNRISYRMTVKPTELPAVSRRIVELLAPFQPVLIAHVPIGILEVGFVPPDVPNSTAIGPIFAGLRSITPAGGHLVWLSAPDECKSEIHDVWGGTRGDFEIMRGIKQALDPESLFSPGRFVGGL